MSRPPVLIETHANDPVAQLLAAGLDAESRAVSVTQQLGPDDTIWVTSQHGFLARAHGLRAAGCAVNVIVRRSFDEASANADETELAILARVAEDFPKGRLSFFGLSEAACQAAQTHGLSVQMISVRGDAPSRVSKRPARIDPGEGGFVLSREDGQEPLDFEAANWARLARDWDLTAAEDAAPDWHDLAAFARRLPAPEAAPLYVFVIPNGVGIGHLTRQMAIARGLQRQALGAHASRMVFWCFSRAAIIAERAGFEVILRHTAEHLNAPDADWLAWETASFAAFLSSERPKAVITDGSRIEPFITGALRQPGCHHARLVWVQRGMWQADADVRGLTDIRFCDLVLIPGDLASASDVGPTGRKNANPPGLSKTTVTAPVVLKVPALSRRAARQALRVNKLRKTCLVSLGGDAFARTTTLYDAISAAARRARVRLLWARSPLAAPPNDTSARTVTLYPMSRYIQAFDGVISATGYNSFHELMLGTDLPVLFIPTANARLDDQPARARFAHGEGWADLVDTVAKGGEADALAAFFAQVKSRKRVARPAALRDGAQEMAQEILALDGNAHDC